MDKRVKEACFSVRKGIDFLLEEFRRFYNQEYEKKTSNSLIFIKKNVEKLSFINKMLSGVSTEVTGIKMDDAVMSKISGLQQSIQSELKGLHTIFSDLRSRYITASLVDSEKLKDTIDRLILSHKAVKGLYTDFEIEEIKRPARTTFSKNKKSIGDYNE